MRVSVHIVTKQRMGELYGLLVSLWKQTYKEWDLILVDSSNPSSYNFKFINDIIGRIKADGHAVKLLSDYSNKGVGRARNIAIENDDLNKLCVRIDDDSILENDFLERLIKTYEEKVSQGIKVGGVGCVVPILVDIGHMINKVPSVLNKVEFGENMFLLGDDCGSAYMEKKVVPAHHLRSSFLFDKEASILVGNHPEHLGLTGFREETVFCLNMLMKGYKFYVDTGAVCWHQMASAGGVRTDDYVEQVNKCNDWFNSWVLKHRVDIEKNLEVKL